jgi:TolB-like protein/Tfp pilus assembly protein PilF
MTEPIRHTQGGKEQSPKQEQEKSSSGFTSFWNELRRRKVVRVATVYVVTGWIIIQVASSTFENFDIPVWAFRFVTLMVVLGLPLAVILAWAFELTPEGIKTTKAALSEQRNAPLSEKQQKKRNWIAYATGAAIPTLIFGILAAVFSIQNRSSDSELPALSSSLSTSDGVEYDKSIAVLPFTNMSANQEHAYFADGVHETILTDLANLRELRVVSRTSVMPYRRSDKSMITIGEELGVAYILIGSMQRAGDHFRLTAQLIDARIDEQLWAKPFDGELTNIFSVQSQLARDIASALQALLTPQEEQQLDRPESASIEAYEVYLKALESFHRRGTGNIEGINLLKKAVALDPAFTDAWLKLVREMGTEYLNGVLRTDAAEREIKKAAETAIRLEPDNPKVLMGLGHYYYNCHLDFSRARFYVNQVAEKLPQYAMAPFALGAISRREGKWAENVFYFNRALLLDPTDLTIVKNLMRTYWRHRDWEKAAKLLDSFPDEPSLEFVKTQIKYRATGFQEARKLYAEAVSKGTRQDRYYGWLFETGNLQAFKEENIIDRWKKESFLAPFFNYEDLTAAQQAIVLHLSGESDLLDSVLNYIIAEADRRWEASKEDFRGQLALGMAWALKGNFQEAQAAADLASVIRSEAKDANTGGDIARGRAIVLAWIGKKDEAVAELVRLKDKPGSGIHFQNLKNNLEYAPLRDHPGFQALLEDPSLKEPIPIKNW